MKNLRTTLIHTLVLFSLSNIAHAEGTIVVFVDKNGKAEFVSSPLSTEEINTGLGLDKDTPKKGESLVIEEGKKPVWTTEDISEIDKRYGGDGSPIIKLPIGEPKKPINLEDIPAKKPTKLDDIPANKPTNLDDIPEKKPTELSDIPEKKDIKIFDDVEQPEDGTWQLSVLSNTYDASCPKDPFPPKSIAGMTRPVDINWGTPWKPTAFFQHYPNPSGFNYKQLSPTQWSVSGVPFKLPSSSAAAAPNMKILIEQNFTLINPRELKVNATLTMKMTVRGMKLLNCKGHLKMLAKHKKSPKIKIN